MCITMTSYQILTERSPCKEENSAVFVEWVDDGELLSFSVQGVDGWSTQAKDVLHCEDNFSSFWDLQRQLSQGGKRGGNGS
jgi:hypothetical protein